MPTFTAHRLSSNANTLFPDKIEIDAANVTCYKGNIFGYQSTIIARSNMASGLRKREAKEIINLLT
jgi:hypothetical protein